MKRKMTEAEFRKYLIKEGFWSWLFGRPEPIIINWNVIEENMGYDIEERAKDRYRKILLGSLYQILTEDAMTSRKRIRKTVDYEEGATKKTASNSKTTKSHKMVESHQKNINKQKKIIKK